MKLSYCYDIIQ